MPAAQFAALATAATTPTTPASPAPAAGPAEAAPVGSVLRIDAGRGPHTDLSGRTWSRDEGFAGGTVSVSPYEVGNTFEDPLYYTRRWGNFD